MNSLNVQGYRDFEAPWTCQTWRGRVIVAEMRPDEMPNRSIVLSDAGDRPDIGRVLASSGTCAVYRKGRGWIPSEEGYYVPVPSVGDRVLFDWRAGHSILKARFGDEVADRPVKVFGNGIPASSVTFAHATLTPWWDQVLATMDENGQFLRMHGDKILVQADPTPESQGSILLPETVQRKAGLGTVLMVGPLARNWGVEEGQRVSFQLELSKVFSIAGDGELYVMKPESLNYVM